MSSLIPKVYGELPLLPDFFFNVIPEIKFAPFLADITQVFALVLALYLVVKKKYDLSALLLALAIMWFIRALLIFVTPIGDPSGDTYVYGFLERVVMYGMFPSGHTGFLSAILFWSYKKKNKFENLTLIALLLTLAFALLSSRGHYTIDIVGGFALGYFAVKWSELLLKRFTLAT